MSSSSRRVAFLIACGFALRAGVAAGQTLAAATETPVATEEHWYGWQTMIADAGAVGLTAAGFGIAAAADGRSKAGVNVVYAGLGAFVFGGPIVHAAHGHWAKAGGSLALRLGLPVLLWAAAFSAGLGSCDDPDGGCGAEVLGAFAGLAGVVLAVWLDAGLLARERVAAPVRSQPIVAFTPLRDGGALSLVGRF